MNCGNLIGLTRNKYHSPTMYRKPKQSLPIITFHLRARKNATETMPLEQTRQTHLKAASAHALQIQKSHLQKLTNPSSNQSPRMRTGTTTTTTTIKSPISRSVCYARLFLLINSQQQRLYDDLRTYRRTDDDLQKKLC